MISGKTSISFLDVPFNEKDTVKKYLLWNSDDKTWETRKFSAFGIKWDYKNKKWYDESEEATIELVNKYKRIYLIVPFDDKDYVKTNGGRWDPIKKQWYAIASNEALKIYMPEDYLYEAVKGDLHYNDVDIESWNETTNEKKEKLAKKKKVKQDAREMLYKDYLNKGGELLEFDQWCSENILNQE
jgi:hypothetical protein